MKVVVLEERALLRLGMMRLFEGAGHSVRGFASARSCPDAAINDADAVLVGRSGMPPHKAAVALPPGYERWSEETLLRVLYERCVPASATATLTLREQETLRLLALGLSNRDIAERLYLSEKTVRLHLTRVFRKLGVSTRAAAVAWFFTQNTTNVL